MTPTHASAQQTLAEKSAFALWSRDQAAQALGMELLVVTPGYARMKMAVRNDMLNGHNICHGGMMFTLADTCFAYACNSYNQNTVASACHIDFLATAREHDQLEAEAIERSLSGRMGVYDITVRNQDQQILALFRGKSCRISGTVIATPTSI